MKNKTYDLCINAIQNFRDVNFPVEDTEKVPIREDISNFILAIENSYVLIQWPNCQLYMEEEWFENEAILVEASDDFSFDAYFIPLKRLLQ